MSHPLSQRLDALRHRAWLVAALECASVGAAAGAIGGAAVSGRLAIALGAAGIALGLIVSRSLVPSRIEVARLVDRRFALQERTVTAVEAEQADDAMAALLRDDAWQRVSAREPAEVFAPKRGRLIGAAAVIVVAAAWSFQSPAAIQSTPAPRSAATAAAGNTGAVTPMPADGAEGTAAAADMPSLASPAQDDTALPPPSSAASAPASTNRADTPPAAASLAGDGGVGRAPVSGGMTARGQGGVQGKPGRALSGVTALSLGVPPEAAAADAAPAAAAAAARARAALTRRDLPPGLRTYVRDYLLLVAQ